MSAFGLFHTGDLDYAVPLVQIRKIIQGSTIFPLPLLPAGINHVLVHQSTLIPVLLSSQSGNTLEHCSASDCYALVDSEYGPLAFVTQSGSRIVADHKGTLSVAGEREASWQVGTFYYQERTYKILDVDALALGIVRGNGSICLTPSGARRLNEEEAAAGR
jgi:chemotaxis signal transduction protein